MSEQELNDSKAADKKNQQISNAKLRTDCLASASLTINKLHGGTLDSVTTMRELCETAKKIRDGDLQEVEFMLLAQAKTLDSFFYQTLSQIPELNMLNQTQVLADLALKAQNQSRKALTALAEIKHPKRSATFIRQQNNHAVNQQVNNGVKSTNKEFKKSEKIANEVIWEAHLEKMDDGRTLTAISINTSAETMDACNRSSNN